MLSPNSYLFQLEWRHLCTYPSHEPLRMFFSIFSLLQSFCHLTMISSCFPLFHTQTTINKYFPVFFCSCHLSEHCFFDIKWMIFLYLFYYRELWKYCLCRKKVQIVKTEKCNVSVCVCVCVCVCVHTMFMCSCICGYLWVRKRKRKRDRVCFYVCV